MSNKKELEVMSNVLNGITFVLLALDTQSKELNAAPASTVVSGLLSAIQWLHEAGVEESLRDAHYLSCLSGIADALDLDGGELARSIYSVLMSEDITLN